MSTWPERIVLAHNYYGSEAPSGENLVFEAERDLLRSRGHEVIEFTRQSDEIRRSGAMGLVRGALSTPWNPFSRRRLCRVLAREEPAILHVHNTFPLLSNSVLHATRGSPTATVLTLHNHRAYCAAAVLLRGGTVCTECLDRRSVAPALRHGCYRGSRLATAPLAAAIALHRALGTLTRHVDAFIVFTEFQRDLAVRAGLPAQRIHIRPNFHPNPPASSASWALRRGALYVGRLAEEKGVPVLLEAWRRWGEAAPHLTLAGDGPDRSRLEALARDAGLATRVRFLGRVSPDQIERLLRETQVLVVPSIWFEGYPLVVREAFASGVPVAASRLGPLATIVEDGRSGIHFAAGNAEELATRLRAAFDTPGRLEALGTGARRVFEETLTVEAGYASLRTVYTAAAEAHLRAR